MPVNQHGTPAELKFLNDHVERRAHARHHGQSAPHGEGSLRALAVQNYADQARGGLIVRLTAVQEARARAAEPDHPRLRDGLHNEQREGEHEDHQGDGGAGAHAFPPCAVLSRAVSLLAWRPTPRAGFPTTRLPGGTSLVTTEPAPVVAPSPTLSGAMSRGVTANECPCANHGAMLVRTVEIAGDGAGADITFLADLRVANV